jgi:type IV pilus assembly protein PilW
MKTLNKYRFKTYGCQKGLSLIELMISVAIGLLLLASLSILFVNQSKTRLELDKQNRMIDNGRYALDLLSENLRMAGFYGELDPFSVYTTSSDIDGIITTNPLAFDPCNTVAANIEKSIVWHVQGFNAATASASVTSPPSCLPSSLKAGSDVLVIRRAHTNEVPKTSAVANTTYLQVSLCIPKTSGAELPYYVRKAPNTYDLSIKTCIAANSGTSANLRRFLVQIYFIDSNNQAGDGIPTLKVAELDESSNFVITPLVEGIEFLQVDYGIDGVDINPVDGIPDRFDQITPTKDTDGVMNGSYVSCATCNVNQWAHVVSLKLNLVSRNLETTTDYIDAKTYSLGTAGSVTPGGNYKRQAYTQVIRLTNPASRKE